jgi:hypothetical protein
MSIRAPRELGSKILYDEFRKVDWGKYSVDTIEGMIERLMKLSGLGTPNIPAEDASRIFYLAARVAHHADLETFSSFLEKGDFPPYKLSKDELRCLKGGNAPLLLNEVAQSLLAGKSFHKFFLQ